MSESIRDRLAVVWDDITNLAVDAIVNAANRDLSGGGGVDGAIHRAAGPELSRACRALGGCPTGEVRLTSGFGLPADFIIHAVGPVWEGGDRGEAELLASCYRAALRLAEAEGFRTVAFPCLSCGIFGYPHELAVPVAVGTVAATLPDCPAIEQVIFVTNDQELEARYLRAVENL
ncbi:O-acetyl-ADP-ribose deacetylase [bacterium]|nr:O-acetyl-ADP-ribose deacetylase [bacterium]